MHTILFCRFYSSVCFHLKNCTRITQIQIVNNEISKNIAQTSKLSQIAIVLISLYFLANLWKLQKKMTTISWRKNCRKDFEVVRLRSAKHGDTLVLLLPPMHAAVLPEVLSLCIKPAKSVMGTTHGRELSRVARFCH